MAIFSKDRACRLGLLLRTIKQQFRIALCSVEVIYHASSQKYEKGYEKLKEREVLFATWHGDTAVEKLNKAYLASRIIEDAPFYETIPKMPHHLVEKMNLCRGEFRINVDNIA